MSMTIDPAETARRELGTGFAGEVIGPGDSDYDTARALFNAMIDKRPAVIARCSSAADVARVVGFARAHDLPLAVRGGGNFGVVTEFTFQAHPVSDVVGGPTFWALEDTATVLAAYREYLPTLPRNATGFFCFHTVPPGPPFPEEIHMRKVCGIVWCI